MKTITRIMFLMGALSLFAVPESRAQQIVVRERLHAPVVKVRPVRPSPRHVWVEEEWAPNGGTYVFKGGYWALPPWQRAAWMPGHWRHTRRGWIWIPGHWG